MVQQMDNPKVQVHPIPQEVAEVQEEQEEEVDEVLLQTLGVNNPPHGPSNKELRSFTHCRERLLRRQQYLQSHSQY